MAEYRHNQTRTGTIRASETELVRQLDLGENPGAEPTEQDQLFVAVVGWCETMRHSDSFPQEQH